MSMSMNVNPNEEVIAPIDTCDLTLTELMDLMRTLIDSFPWMEFFIDGDRYALVARPKA